MVNWLTQSDALRIVKALFWGSVLISFLCFLTDRYLHSVLRIHWKRIVLCVTLVLVWRIPLKGDFFHGMEYEDSYVYTVAGRQIAGHSRIQPSSAALPFSITVCAVGSLNSCRLSDNYPEHLIGYPYILSVFFNIAGYRPSTGSIANIIGACFADALVFLLCILITDDVTTACSAALIFAITPVFAVWGLETSAEPAANCCIVLVLWLCLRFTFSTTERTIRWSGVMRWCAFTATLLLSLTVKRENILLPIVLPVVVFFVSLSSKRSPLSSSSAPWWIVVSATLGFVLSIELNLLQTQSSEVALLKIFPPTAGELLSYLPIFASSFLVIRWYGGAALLVLVGAIVAWRRKTLELFPLLLFASYLLLYSFHLRTYYEMRSGITDARAALRFSMSLMSLWSILAGIGAASALRYLRNTSTVKNRSIASNRIAGCMAALIVGMSYLSTSRFRDDLVKDEFRMRINPALTAVRIAAADHIRENCVITLEPLIPQMYAEPNVEIVSLHEVDSALDNTLGIAQDRVGELYLDEAIHRTTVDTARYRRELDYLNQFQRNTLTSNPVFSVVRIGAVSTGHGPS